MRGTRSVLLYYYAILLYNRGNMWRTDSFHCVNMWLFYRGYMRGTGLQWDFAVLQGVHEGDRIYFVVLVWDFAVLQGVRAGDRILEVNGTDFLQMSHAEAVTLMRNAWNVIMKVQSASSYRQGKQPIIIKH